jgi:hypothetical protein
LAQLLCNELLTPLPPLPSALQLGFLEMFVEPTFKAMAKVCPKTAAQGLHGCAVNAAECRAIMQLQAEQQLPRML